VNAKDAGFDKDAGGRTAPHWFALRPFRSTALGGGGGGCFAHGELLLSFELADSPDSEEAAPPPPKGAAADATAVDTLLEGVERQPAVVVVSVLGARDLRPPVGAAGLNARAASQLPQWPRLECRVQRGGSAPCAVGATQAKRTPAPSDPNWCERLYVPPLPATAGVAGEAARLRSELLLPVDAGLAPMLEARLCIESWMTSGA